jgi:hypothetical protein
MASFSALPPETLQHIIRHLDPISLIALSHTAPWLRVLINPTHHDLVRRLLALELLPEHGGIVPLFRSRDNHLTPPWGSDEWKNNKYACCGCMKLLPHMMFDNHSILRVPYRKPPPGSIEAERGAITDWEPLEPSVRWKHIQARTDDERAEQQKRRTAVGDRYRQLVAPAGQPFVRVDRDRVVAAEEEAERYLCGASRHRRRCLECKHRRGDWSRMNTHRGSKEVPIVVSRQLDFPSKWARYFPGLLEPLPLGRTPRIWRVYREKVTSYRFTLYAVRCSCCGTWQEQAAFRQWTSYKLHPEIPTGPLLCNDCILKTQQTPTLLAQDLSSAVVRMLRGDRAGVLEMLGFGWRILNQDFNGTSGWTARLADYKSVGAEILNGLHWAESDGEYRKEGIVFDESDFPHLRRRLHRYRDFIFHEVDESTRDKVMQQWFRLWVEDYDLLEGKYHWLQEQIDRVEGDPNLVLDYVLARDPYMYRIS